MSAEFITCSCCGELVPESNIELAFRRPDEVAALSDEELDRRCVQTSDICILDGARHFVRCIIPLSVHQSAQAYAIGAWAEIAKRDFDKVQELWCAADQASHPAIAGVLANRISLTTGSFGCRVAVQLAGPKKRPSMMIEDEACSLYQEQEVGIPAHRASAYSDVCRKPASAEKELVLVAEQELDAGACPCCDRRIRTYCGYITDGGNGDVCADYWLRIPEGHDGYFTVAVSIAEGGHARVAVLVGEATHEGLTYHLQDREKFSVG